MKIGVVSRIGEFPPKKWVEEFEIFGKNGMYVNHLELIVNYPYLGPLYYTKEDIKLLRKYAKENKLDLILHLLPNQKGLSKTISQRMFDSKEITEEFVKYQAELYFSTFNIGSLNKDVREESKNEIIRTLKMAGDVGAKLITIHGGSFEKEKEYKKNLKMSRKTLEEVNPYFKDIKLCVENIPTIGHANDKIKEFPKTIEDMLYLINGLENVGICLDVGHANVSGNVLTFYNNLSKTQKIWNLHLHDNLGDKDDHLEIRKGNIPFKELFKKLKEDDYKGFLSIELDTWCRKEIEKNERVKALKYLRKIDL